MACPDDVTVAAWLDGRIADAVRASLEDHIDSCADCRSVCAGVVRSARPAPKTLGRFVLGACLGSGAMGEVYAAFDPQLGRQVALKLPRTDAGDVRRLLREARMMAQVAHPNVVAVYEAGEVDGVPYVVMEHVAGTDLAVRCADGPLETAEVLTIVASVARALAAVHRVGLVHRDVKPANILIDHDGRARLGDFGLAGAEPLLAGGGVQPEGIHLTRTGDILGTPAYMAPEQLRGERATPASDQFALCVVLYELLYGQRPFAGDNLAELTSHVLAGELREPATERKLPAGLGAALRRGLAVDPSARFASLTELADALEPRPRGRKAFVIAGCLGMLAIAGVLFALWPARAADPCSGGAAELGTTWGPARRDALVRAFATSAQPFAAATAAKVSDTLDGYARDWIAAHRAACVANRVRHVESDTLFDQRSACLAERRRRLDALVTALAQPTAQEIERASAARLALPAIRDCDGVRALGEQPAEPGRRALLVAFEQRVASAIAAHELGNYKQALAAAQSLAREVRALDAPRLAAKVLGVLALAQHRTGDEAGSEASFRAALAEAARAGDDHEVARLWSALLYMVGTSRGRSEQALGLVDSARLALVRAGTPPELEAQLESHVGTILRRAGDLAGARKALERALALREQLHGKQAVDTAITLTNYANVLHDAGESREALALHERVIAIHERAHGPAHPFVAQSRANVAALLEALGDHERAAAETRAALAVLEPAWGAGNRRVLLLWNNLGVALGNAGNVADAARAFEHVLEAEERAPLEAADALNGLAKLELTAQRAPRAIELLERCLALREKAQGARHPDVGLTLINLGDALRSAGRCRDALPRYAQAHSLVGVHGAEHRLVGYALAGQGICLSDIGRRSAGIAALEQARAIAAKGQDAVLQAEVDKALARAKR